MEALKTDDEEARRWVRVSLIGIGAARQPLIRALADPQEDVRVRAEAAFILAVMNMGVKNPNELTNALFNALNDN